LGRAVNWSATVTAYIQHSHRNREYSRHNTWGAEMARQMGISSSCGSRICWQQALAQAGLAQRAQPVRVTSNMRNQLGRSTSSEDLIHELRRVANLVGIDNMTIQSFNENSPLHDSLVRRRCGSWSLGCKKAELVVPARSRRYSDDECFENILRCLDALWPRAPPP
jgi:hypothetical protein